MRHQIGITYPDMTGVRRWVNHQGEAQGNAAVRSHRDTRIGDASGVEPEAPQGGRLPNPWERTTGEFSPARIVSGSRRGD